MKRPTLSLVTLILLTACQGPPSSSSTSPSPLMSPSSSAEASPSATATPAQGAFGVLITPPTGPTYTVSLVGIDGQVVATAQAGGFNGSLTCAGIATAVLPPPTSTSNSRVYFMDNAGVVRWLDPHRQTGSVATLPHGGAVRSMFAVSPDDKWMAVIVAAFSATTEHAILYLYDLVAGRSVKVFEQTATTGLWPMGWHGGSLVVAKTRACLQAGGPFADGPIELHVVDPVTAIRRFTVGSSRCVIAGPPTPAGVVCEDTSTFTRANVIDWIAITRRTLTISGPALAYLSPDGAQTALVTNDGTLVVPQWPDPWPDMTACGWIDSQHIMSGGDPQHQSQVADVTNGKMVPVQALGDCGGRIPGEL